MNMSAKWVNLGTRQIKKLRPADFPDISALMKEPIQAKRGEDAVDVLAYGFGHSIAWVGGQEKI